MNDSYQQLDVEVYVEDTDVFGVVYYANYLKYYERGRTHWLKSQGVSLQHLAGHGYQLLVRDFKATWLYPAVLGQTLTVLTRLRKIHQSIAIFEQQIADQSCIIINSAEAKIVALDAEKKLCHIAPLIKTVSDANG